MADPHEPWASPEVVARFAVSPGNKVLHAFAEKELDRAAGNRLLDIGCGAGANAIPLAQVGWDVRGLDLSEPMLDAATKRAAEAGCADNARFEPAPMDQLPVDDESQHFVVAHGVWNLAGSAAEFRGAVREAARVARPGAALFVYTFSRNTFPADLQPVAGESFVFTEFSGRPQCFLTKEQLIEELAVAGFQLEAPITEYPAAAPKPAILEAIFRHTP